MSLITACDCVSPLLRTKRGGRCGWLTRPIVGGRGQEAGQELAALREVGAASPMRQTWTALQQNGPNHLGFWLNQADREELDALRAQLREQQVEAARSEPPPAAAAAVCCPPSWRLPPSCPSVRRPWIRALLHATGPQS